MAEVLLKREALEALTSETKVAVMKELREKQKTLSQIAKSLDLDKATVFRHLQRLSEGKLVLRDDSHSFIYYRLTFQGKALMNPFVTMKLAFVTALSVVLVGIAVYSLIVYYTPRYVIETGAFPASPQILLLPPEPAYLYATIVLVAVAVALAVALALIVKPARRARMTQEEEREEKSPPFPPPPPPQPYMRL